MIDAQAMLVEAGLLPAEMPANYTFNKVRKILSELNDAPPAELNRAIIVASDLEIRAPLPAVIFIKHHLSGRHEVEVDRVVNSDEDNTRYAVLIYAEGEVPVSARHLPDSIGEGTRLLYEPENGAYTTSTES